MTGRSRSRGLLVVIAGPDGAGKSTLAEGITHQQPAASLRLHHRPSVLPRRTRYLGPVTAPHSLPPYPGALSVFKAMYMWLDSLLGWLIRIRPVLRQGGLVVLERGWWDVLVDPLRYRLQVSPALIRVLGRLLPNPDLLLILNVSADVLGKRKQELPKEELERQRQAWLALRAPGVETVVLEATRPKEAVADAARRALQHHLQRRGGNQAGTRWVALPGGQSPRWWIPRGPRTMTLGGLGLYQPLTAKGRLGWDGARWLGLAGGFRLLPAGQSFPIEVLTILRSLWGDANFAVMRSNHPGRHLALHLGHDGVPTILAKIGTTDDARHALRREATALEEYAGFLTAPVRAPALLGTEDGILLMEAIPWRPRRRPWDLPPEVAAALGSLASRGLRHGDAAPWNLLATSEDFVLCDWEEAGATESFMEDVCHYIVQSFALLGRPKLGAAVEALAGRGPFGNAVRVYADSAGSSLEEVPEAMGRYLEISSRRLALATRDGRRGLRARVTLAAEIRRAFGVVTTILGRANA
jgi:thymidylate kinase